VFPLTLELLAKLKNPNPETAPKEPYLPKVSVIMAVYNEAPVNFRHGLSY